MPPQEKLRLLTEIDVEVRRTNFADSSFVRDLGLLTCGGPRQALLDADALRAVLGILKRCDRIV